jgi:RNA polymerase sigma factor (sigma-70 family)
LNKQIAREALSNQDLALAAQAGDHEARNALYLRYRRLMSIRIAPAKRLASWLEATGAPVSAEDVEQEAFVIFCRLLELWRPDRAPFAPFLLEMLSHAAFNYVRAFQRAQGSYAPRAEKLSGSSAGGEEEGVPPLAAKGQPRQVGEPADVTILRADTWTQLLSHLPGELARLVHLRYREDRSSRQIAKSEGCSQRTVDRDLQLALASIQELMREEMEVR